MTVGAGPERPVISGRWGGLGRGCFSECLVGRFLRVLRETQLVFPSEKDGRTVPGWRAGADGRWPLEVLAARLVSLFPTTLWAVSFVCASARLVLVLCCFTAEEKRVLITSMCRYGHGPWACALLTGRGWQRSLASAGVSVKYRVYSVPSCSSRTAPVKCLDIALA